MSQSEILAAKVDRALSLAMAAYEEEVRAARELYSSYVKQAEEEYAKYFAEFKEVHDKALDELTSAMFKEDTKDGDEGN